MKVSNIYDTQNEKSLERMKFKRSEDGTWVRQTGVNPPRGLAPPPAIEDEAKIRHIEVGLDPQADMGDGLHMDFEMPPISGQQPQITQKEDDFFSMDMVNKLLRDVLFTS